MARPKKNPEDKMVEGIVIPMTASQKQLIIDASNIATTNGHTGWARDILLEAARKQLGSSQAQGSRAPKR